MENEEKKLYYINDQYLISYLILEGHNVEKVEVYENEFRKKVDFYFEPTKELKLNIKDFKENEFLQKYNAQLREVRKIIGQTLRGEQVGE